MASSDDYCLRLSRMPLLAASLIASVFPAVWLLERFGVIDKIGLAWLTSWTLFVFGFVCPVSMFLLYLAWRHDPVILISGGTVSLRHVTWPWKTTSLSMSEVDWVETDWDPQDETSPCSLKIYVPPSCFDRECRRSPWLCGEEGFLTVLLDNTEESPDKVATTINLLLSQTKNNHLRETPQHRFAAEPPSIR